MTTFKAVSKLALGVLLASLLFAAPAMAELKLERFAIGAQNENGTQDVQAGSHPYALTNTFVLSGAGPEDNLRNVRLELPPGFVGDPTATPRCTYQDFSQSIPRGSTKTCSNEAAIGLATTYVIKAEHPTILFPTTSPVYNLVPPPGVAAEFGYVVLHTTAILLQTSVRTGTDYGLTTNVPNINQAVVVAASKVTIWGVPAAPIHDAYRGTCEQIEGGEESAGGSSVEQAGLGLSASEDELEGPLYPFRSQHSGMPETLGSCATQAPELPLLTNPTSCEVPRTAKFSVDDWKEPGNFETGEHVFSITASLPELTGCEKLDFSPTLTVTPDKPDASTSSGLTVNVKVPQETALNPVGLAEADVRDTTVMLPPGVALNPAGANGLEACSSNPSALAAGELGSPGDGIGYETFKELTSEPGVSLPIFTPSVPGSIAAKNAASVGLLNTSEDVLQPGLNFCSNASKIGTVRIKTPVLEHELTGTVYLAAQEANPFGSLMAIYAIAEDPVSGALIKVPGEISLCKAPGEVIAGETCQALGQVVTTLLNTPQLPFEEFEAHFFGGEKAPLTTPASCGVFTTQTSFVPWTSTTAVDATAPFTIEHGPNGGPCPGSSLPFSPSLTGGALNVNAGAFSPFTLTMTRSDGEQNLESVAAHLPPGLSGILSNVELCPEPQASEGECGPNSLIGETTVSVGVGGDPYTVTGGKFYLTGPYNGTGACNVSQAGCAPFGITFTIPAKAGPFDLAHTKSFSPTCDCILVRGKIEVNPFTAALTVTSNPPGTSDSIPTSIEGIPLEIQHINATTTRSNFQFNPTDCNKMAVTGTIDSSEGGTDTIAVPFQVTNCQALKFTPKFSVSTAGKTSKADGASLTATLTEPNEPQGSQANIAAVKVDLPKALPSRLKTLQKACLAKVFEANPAACPSASFIGHALVHTPLLPVPLEGPAIFVSHGGEEFPSLTMVLQGDGVTIDLVGATYISPAGITSTTFKTVPDVPFSTFTLTLPQGPYSALGTNLPEKDDGNLCGQTLAMPTYFIAQNGAEIHESTPISVAGCSSSLSFTSSIKKQSVTLSVYVPAAGKVAASGKGLSSQTKIAKGRQLVTFTLTQKRAGRLKTTVRVAFTPSTGKDRKRQARSAKVTFKK